MNKCIVLVTGFDWYRSITGNIFHPNPSGLVAESLDNVVLNECRIKGLVLNVDFSSIEVLNSVLDDLKPDIVIGLGLNPSALDPLIELTGVNYGYYRNNSVGFNNFLYRDSPLSLSIQIDFKKLLDYIENRGFTVKLSNTSGLYLCNAVAYTIYRYSMKYRKPAVFLHIPPVGDLRLRLGLSINTSWSIDLLKKLVLSIIEYFMEFK